MDGDIDYSKYSASELQEAMARIDKQRYPINYATLLKEAASRPISQSLVPGESRRPALTKAIVIFLRHCSKLNHDCLALDSTCAGGKRKSLSGSVGIVGHGSNQRSICRRGNNSTVSNEGVVILLLLRPARFDDDPNSCQSFDGNAARFSPGWVLYNWVRAYLVD
jgi:hypothetical protein